MINIENFANRKDNSIISYTFYPFACKMQNAVAFISTKEKNFPFPKILEKLSEELSEAGYKLVIFSIADKKVLSSALFISEINTIIKSSRIRILFKTESDIGSEVMPDGEMFRLINSSLSTLVKADQFGDLPTLPIFVSLEDKWENRRNSFNSLSVLYSNIIPIDIDGTSNYDVGSKGVQLGETEVINSILRTILLRSSLNRDTQNSAQEERQRKIESTMADFVSATLEDLEAREGNLRLLAGRWYITGYLSLISGVVTAIIFAFTGYQVFDNWVDIVLLSIKGALIIILLISGSKYSFNLAKTYMNEALKNGDRIHAISFGKFFLQIFGDTASIDDVKEVFKDWNIDRPSEFTKLSGNDYDPQLIDTLFKAIEIGKGLNTSETKKTKKQKGE